jgi:hypothetical protein
MRPVVTYACQAWLPKDKSAEVDEVWKEELKKNLQTHYTWRIKTNEELANLVEYENIISFIKAQRLRWLGHLDNA